MPKAERKNDRKSQAWLKGYIHRAVKSRKFLLIAIVVAVFSLIIICGLFKDGTGNKESSDTNQVTEIENQELDGDDFLNQEMTSVQDDIEIIDELIIDDSQGEIIITESGLSAKVIYATVNTRIRWLNESANNCDFYLYNADIEILSDIIGSNDEVDYTFNSEGSYVFECKGQNGLFGAVNVSS